MNLRQHLITGLIAATCFAGVGCEDLGLSGDDSSSSSRREQDRERLERRDDRIIGSRTDARIDDRGLDGIPSDARRVTTGEGRELFFEAEERGTLYVYDADDRRVVFSGPLYPGENFMMDPGADRVEVNGKQAADFNLRAGHRYEVYFDRD